MRLRDRQTEGRTDRYITLSDRRGQRTKYHWSTRLQ